MVAKSGYCALPHSAVECEQQQQPGGYGVYGSQDTTTPYNPQLQQIQQPGGYSGHGSQVTPYNSQMQQVQQPCGYGGYGSQGTTTPYNPQLQQSSNLAIATHSNSMYSHLAIKVPFNVTCQRLSIPSHHLTLQFDMSLL